MDRELDMIFEMANLRTENTNLQNCIYISSREHSAGPRLKIFKQGNCKGDSISVKLTSKKFEYIDKKNIFKDIDKKTITAVKQLIAAYEDILLLFWFDADCIVDDEFKKKLANFIKTGVKEQIIVGEECIGKLNKIRNKLKGV